MEILKTFYIYDTYMEPLVRVDVLVDGTILTTRLKSYYGASI